MGFWTKLTTAEKKQVAEELEELRRLADHEKESDAKVADAERVEKIRAARRALAAENSAALERIAREDDALQAEEVAADATLRAVQLKRGEWRSRVFAWGIEFAARDEALIAQLSPERGLIEAFSRELYEMQLAAGRDSITTGVERRREEIDPTTGERVAILEIVSVQGSRARRYAALCAASQRARRPETWVDVPFEERKAEILSSIPAEEDEVLTSIRRIVPDGKLPPWESMRECLSRPVMAEETAAVARPAPTIVDAFPTPGWFGPASDTAAPPSGETGPAEHFANAFGPAAPAPSPTPATPAA